MPNIKELNDISIKYKQNNIGWVLAYSLCNKYDIIKVITLPPIILII